MPRFAVLGGAILLLGQRRAACFTESRAALARISHLLTKINYRHARVRTDDAKPPRVDWAALCIRAGMR